jgi:hypothetical protein
VCSINSENLIYPVFVLQVKIKKIFKVSTNQNTLLALAISDLLQNNKSGMGPSNEYSNNAKYSICRVVSHKKVFE